jgi:putative PIN family toxin of toxin-antitoxin system
MIRAAVDTSVLVSSLLVPAGVPAQVIRAWRVNRFVLVSSPAILAEARRTLEYPRIRRKYPLTDGEVSRFLALVETEAEVARWEPDVSPARIRDPKDEMVLACALAGSASFLVSSDQDLLTVGEYRGVRIVTPRQFLVRLEEREGTAGTGPAGAPAPQPEEMGGEAPCQMHNLLDPDAE